MLMEAAPVVALVMAKAKLLLELLIVPLDPPARLGHPHEAIERTAPGQVRGHSILITSDSTLCQDAVEVHGVAPQGIGDVVDLVEAQDVEGETAQDGEDGRALADAAGGFLHGDVQYVMNAVLHAPVAAGRDGIIGRAAVG